MESITLKSISKRHAPGGEEEFMIRAELTAFPLTSDGCFIKDADDISFKKIETKYFSPETTISKIFYEFKNMQDEWQDYFNKLMNFLSVVNWVNEIAKDSKK